MPRFPKELWESLERHVQCKKHIYIDVNIESRRRNNRTEFVMVQKCANCDSPRRKICG